MNKNENIVICGDSFNVGIGCRDLLNDPYGSLLSKKFDKKLINLAKGSSSNLSIYLQVKYAIENIKNIDFMCVGVTCNNRTEWFSERTKNYEQELSNTMINYHQYPPYQYNDKDPYIDSPIKNDINYTGDILTENYFGIIDYVNNHLDNPNNNRYNKFKYESDEKIRLLKDYFFNFFDNRIQRLYDMGVILMAHNLLKNNNIQHYFLTNDEGFKTFIPEQNLIFVDWLELAIQYPDDLNTNHTSEKGHIIVYEKILSKINN